MWMEEAEGGWGGYSHGEVKISRVMALCKGWVSGEE